MSFTGVGGKVNPVSAKPDKIDIENIQVTDNDDRRRLTRRQIGRPTPASVGALL